MENLFDGIDIFFDSIKAKCSTREEYAAEILKARGFLLEDNAFVLSDNSHSHDAVYLNRLLTADNLGEVVDNKIIIRADANVEKIFYSNDISGSESCDYDGYSWRKFAQNSYAIKVPLELLEPFIGRYIKSISACGVSTCGSCDGNHSEMNQQRILIEFIGHPDSVWHKIICMRLLIRRFNLRFILDNSRLKIPFTPENKWQTYIELNRAAEFLYNNRLTLRQIRRQACDNITNSMARHLPDEELAQIFSDSADKLLRKFFPN